MEVCVKCGNPAIAGITSDIGPLCKAHIYEHQGIPVGEAQEEASCRSCRRIIKFYDACFIQDSGFWHCECLERYLRKIGKCPKHGMDPSTCGCWGDPIAKLVGQAREDAMAIWESGGRHELCHMCLKFNRATAMGLALYPSPPERAKSTCVSCFRPICDRHEAYLSEKNVLGLSTKDIYCTGGWVDGCYQDLEKKVACSFEDCETTRRVERDSDFDPLVDSKKCEKCEAFYCNWIAGHEQCPECEGYPCEGEGSVFDPETKEYKDCERVLPDEYLYNYQTDSYSFKKLCEGCLSFQEQEDIGTALGDWVISDFSRELVSRFETHEMELDLDDAELEELFTTTASECGVDWEHHSDGPSINAGEVAECINPFSLLEVEGVEINGLKFPRDKDLVVEATGEPSTGDTCEDIYGSTWRRVVVNGQVYYQWRETDNDNAQWKRHPTNRVPGSVIGELSGVEATGEPSSLGEEIYLALKWMESGGTLEEMD